MQNCINPCPRVRCDATSCHVATETKCIHIFFYARLLQTRRSSMELQQLSLPAVANAPWEIAKALFYPTVHHHVSPDCQTRLTFLGLLAPRQTDGHARARTHRNKNFRLLASGVASVLSSSLPCWLQLGLQGDWPLARGPRRMGRLQVKAPFHGHGGLLR